MAAFEVLQEIGKVQLPIRRTSTYQPAQQPLDAVTRQLHFGDDGAHDCQDD